MLCPAETPVLHLTPQLYTDEDIMKDPLTVLRCDRRVFRYVSEEKNNYVMIEPK